MKPAKAIAMNEQDLMITKAFFAFMFSPLVLLMLVGASMAISSYIS